MQAETKLQFDSPVCELLFSSIPLIEDNVLYQLYVFSSLVKILL